MQMKSFDDLMEIAANTKNKTSFSVELDLEIGNEFIEFEVWKAREAIISPRYILLQCDKGLATYAVGSYGEHNVAELVAWCTTC